MDFPQGIRVTESISVESPDHVSEILTHANERQLAVLPIGAGTCLSTGYPTENDFLAVDLARLSGIDSYIPTDMTASFQAGTPMRVVRATLAEQGQELPIDISPDNEGTIGGLVATGFSGPRRFGQGTLKDLIIGCEYVRGDGLLAKAGGMTVKNVSGFEISRLLHGSWGSLAILTRINLKVIPKARADRTFVWKDKDLAAALDRQLRLLSGFPGCIALQTTSDSNHHSTSIRFMSRESAMEDYQRKVSEAEGQPDEIHDNADIWLADSGQHTAPWLVANNSVEHSQALSLTLDDGNGFENQSVSFPTGTVRASIDTQQLTAVEVAAAAMGLWMIEGGDSAWKNNAPVWGPARADLEVTRSIKNQFDPANILNRGRLFV